MITFRRSVVSLRDNTGHLLFAHTSSVTFCIHAQAFLAVTKVLLILSTSHHVKVLMKTVSPILSVACHQWSGKYSASPGPIVHSNSLPLKSLCMIE